MNIQPNDVIFTAMAIRKRIVFSAFKIQIRYENPCGKTTGNSTNKVIIRLENKQRKPFNSAEKVYFMNEIFFVVCTLLAGVFFVGLKFR